MIARLCGQLVEREGTRAIVDVAGVGYEVFAPGRTLDLWGEQDQIVAWVSTQVREDAITLYGFGSDLDRKAFGVLLLVSGFGPKGALAALDALTVPELHRAVEHDDLATLGRIPGVGAKKAQRLALELKGKLPVSFEVVAAARPSRTQPADPLPLALAQLEYGRSEIQKALQALDAQGIAADAPLEQRLKAALTALASSNA
ncbi:MAG: Holliday junction branch migration protein RuvA [Myxococcota bacterium]